MSQRKKEFIVKVPDLAGVTNGQWAEHIKSSVESWGKAGHPDDWSFNFGKVSVLPRPETIGWHVVDHDFLKNKPMWFTDGPLWIWSPGMKEPEQGRYEWQQGWEPDRLLFVGGGDREAFGFQVKPFVTPPPPVRKE